MDPTSGLILQQHSRKPCLLAISLIWILSWNLRPGVVMASNDQVGAPPNRPTPVNFYNAVGVAVHIHCTGWPQALDPNDRVIQNDLQNHQGWNVNYGNDLFQERLSCGFRHYERSWNCLRVFFIPQMCVWENPQLIVSRGSSPSPESCPVCDLHNVEGEIICAWRLDDSGLHLLRRDIFTNRNVRDVKARWVETVTDSVIPQETFHLRFENYFELPVTLHCGVRGDFGIRAFGAGLGAMVWERTLRVETEAARNGGDASWECDIVVHTSEGRRWHRTGIRLWDSPVGFDCEDDYREPPCIDCAWSLHAGALWVDQSGCEDPDAARWVKRYHFFGVEIAEYL